MVSFRPASTRLHDCADARALHGRVTDLGGVRVAGLGGNFLGRVWMPPAQPLRMNRHEAIASGRHSTHGADRPSPKLNAAIYPDDWRSLARERADILVTHEAPSCHPHGFEPLDELARSLGVVRSFHGHHHDDRTAEYASQRQALGFDAQAVGLRAIKNGLGELIWPGEQS